MRKLNKQTIKPVLRWLGYWNSTTYSLNTEGAVYYAFTFTEENGKPSWTGRFEWCYDDCFDMRQHKPYEDYAICLTNGRVYDLNTDTPLFIVKKVEA